MAAPKKSEIIAALTAERDALLAERDALREQRDALQTERDRELGDAEAQIGELRADLATAEAETARLRAAADAAAERRAAARPPPAGRMLTHTVLSVNLADNEPIHFKFKGRAFQAAWRRETQKFACAELGNEFTTPSGFAVAAMDRVEPGKAHAANGWAKCWVVRNGRDLPLNLLRTAPAAPAEPPARPARRDAAAAPEAPIHGAGAF